MRGDATPAEADGGAADCAAADRRPSITTLQNMLKKVSPNPFHSQYKTLGASTSDSSGSSVNGSQHKQCVELFSDPSATAVMDDQQLHVGQETGSRGPEQHAGWKTSEEENLRTIVIPRPEFQSSPLDLQPQMKTELPKDLFQTLTPPSRTHGRFQTRNASANGHFHDVPLNTPDFFKPIPAQTQNPSKPSALKSSDLFQDEGVDLFQTAKAEDFLRAERTREVSDKSPSLFDDPFKSPSNETDDPFRSPSDASSTKDWFHAGPTKSGGLFQKPDVTSFSKENLDIFSSSSTNAVDPFPSPISGDLFQDVSALDDPFAATPARQYNPFRDASPGTPDIFRPLPSKADPEGISGITSGNAAAKATDSTSSLNRPSETLDTPSSPSLFTAAPADSQPAVQPKSADGPHDIFLTTPQGTEYDIFQPSPFRRTRNLSRSPSQSPGQMTHVSTFRRPPKPLPRTRPPRTEKPPRPDVPPKPERPPTPVKPIKPQPTAPKTFPKPAFSPPPKPVLPSKPQTPETKPLEPENNAVFEDVLLIGQERCVEDWPDDSPELNPDFKPSGTLRLRRESMKVKVDSDGGSGEDQDGSGSHVKKRDKKFRLSRLSTRGSMKFSEDPKEGRVRSLPPPRKSSKEYFSEVHEAAEENEDGENGMDYKKKHLKTKVNQLLRRASTNSFMSERKHLNGRFPEDSKQDDDFGKKSLSKKDSVVRRWSEGTALDESTAEEEEEWGGAQHTDGHGSKKKKKVKIRFVPQRGFSITVEKKGAHGYTPRKSSKEKPLDEAVGAHGYTPRMKSQQLLLDDAHQRKKSSFSEDLDHENGPEDCKPELFPEDDFPQTGADFVTYDSEEQEVETPKQKKPSKLKGFKKHKTKSKAPPPEHDDPPGAASNDFLSEAAKAEWLAAQMDERTVAGLEDEDVDGDTDSLMEWWYTVEQWDEVPSDDEDKMLKEDESKSFTILADKVERGLRVFNKIFTEHAEVLWQSIITLHAIADDISNFHHKAKIAGITGGTTTAVGGVAAIAGLALAPFTFGASLVITAVGVGVATAGGITSASAAISDNVNNMHDRKKVEIVLGDYEVHLLTIGKILHFVNQGLYKLRGHPFLRSGTQHYSKDWEVRRAVQMISLVDSPVMRGTEITDAAVAALQGIFKGMGKYFTKDSRELKKGCRKEVVAQIKEVANILNDGIVELNAIREELQDATGYV